MTREVDERTLLERVGGWWREDSSLLKGDIIVIYVVTYTCGFIAALLVAASF